MIHIKFLQMNKNFFFAGLLIFSGIIFSVFGQTVWPPDCATLQKRPYPRWFKDAKPGIFIHWGVYSVPAYGGKESYGEWYLRGLQVGDTLRTNFMKRVYGKDFTYRDFAPLFKAELYRPGEWATLFKEAGKTVPAGKKEIIPENNLYVSNDVGAVHGLNAVY